MLLEADAKLAFPRPVVFAAYRDKLVDLVPFLPNVRGIDVRSREEDGDIVRLVNIWRGGGEIPAVARSVLSESMLSWTDRATWNAADFTCEWRIETHAFTEAVLCAGKNRFLDQDGATMLEIRGELGIDAKKIKGVPGFLARTVGHAVEEFLVSKIRPNLLEVSQGLRRYLEQQRGAG